MAKKTNKTAHLLNTLTSGTPESEETSAKEAGAGAAPENKVIVVNETSENEKLSNEIKNLLESQLEEEMAEAKGSGENFAIAGIFEEKEEADNKAEPAVGEEEPAKPEPAAVSEEVAEAKEKPEEDSRNRAYNMMNVMERLLANMENEMENEMRQNGVCMCDRCRADVQALVLTQMPAKYVIVDSTNISPIMGYYENRYKIPMLTEILKACTKVKEQPRH
ncbi:MAG: late competence development ComFB family protein [Lachnospiraceae bacterium]|nr:late competence development ComFB family protein [Lachnospiraceae bacterium]